MSRNRDRSKFLWSASVVVVACLALAGCGRKGPLDPPPGAAAAGDAAQPKQSGLVAPMLSPIGGGSSSDSKSSSAEPSIGPDGRPLAGKGRNRPFVLDGLLN